MSRFDSSKFERIEHNKQGVILRYNDSSAFTKGTDIPLKVLKEVENYRQDYAKDAVEFATEEANKLFSKEKSLPKVTVEFPYSTIGRGNIAVEFDRTAKVNVPNQDEKIAKVQLKVKVKDPFAKVSKDKVIKVCEEKLHKFVMK